MENIIYKVHLFIFKEEFFTQKSIYYELFSKVFLVKMIHYISH